MRKFFLLIPALVLSLFTNAAVININTGTPDALRVALSTANDGDEIVMAAGTYVESNSNFIAFDGKNVLVRAKEGAEVIIQPQVPITVANGGCAHFQNVKIDASHLNDIESWYEHIIYAQDAAANNRIILDGCEIYNFALNKSLISCPSASALDALTINNCYFHNINKSCVFIENTSNAIAINITNSTFANITTDASGYYAGVIDSRATSGSFLVDHCTFYNVQVMSTDYAAIGNKNNTPSGSVVSNCIFAMPSSVDGVRAIRNIEQANNCLTFNYIKDGGGIYSSVTKNNCILNQDPLFTDAANVDFSYAGNWITMTLSPARGAATDGSDLGDPRWAVAETLPTTDFATPYQLKGNKAKLSGNIWYDDVNDYLYGDGGHNKTYGTATWKIHAEKACIVEVALNLNAGNTSGHSIRIEILDADGNSVGEFAEAVSTLPGTLVIPAEGDYTIILHNDTEWSSAMIDNITFSYIGGDVQAMPGTTDINDAWFSSNGTRADGKISYSSISSGCWAKWNINVASAGTYNVTVNIQNEYGHNYAVEFLKEGESTPISVSEGEIKYGHDATLYPVEVGAITLEPGNYEMTVSNAVGDAALLNVTLTYAGGAAIDLSKTTPASLLANADAILSSDWSIEAGKIVHAESKALTGWAKWNVDCANDGNYNVTVNIDSDNGHLVRVEVFEDENDPAIYTLDEAAATKYHTGEQAIDLGNIALEDKEYVFKVSNTVSSSHVQIASIVITYQGGASATLPATLDPIDALFSEKAYADAGEIYFSPDATSQNVLGQWAKWNVKVATAGTFLFTLNVSSTNSQTYKITILDGETVVDSYEKHPSSGAQTIKHYFSLAAGNYAVKVENTYSWSDGHVVSLVVTAPELLTINEAAEANTVIHNNYRNGTHDIQIIRTITAGMYNTICLPFDVSSSILPQIFGSDVELKQMSSAELNGDELDLIFADATSIYRGTPYLIKTSSNVVNPIFTDVEIKEEEGQATSGTNADFIGTFIKGTIPAGEDNLFLGQNNLLYFSDNDTPIKGMRAYFQVKGVPHPSQAIRHANIIANDQVVTSIDFTKGENNKVMKAIENGQLIIIRNGVRFTVQGQRIQ